MIEKLEISILSVDRKLDEIKNSYPYNKLDLLKSKEKLAEYKYKLNKSLKELKKSYKLYDDKINQILSDYNSGKLIYSIIKDKELCGDWLNITVEIFLDE